MLVRGGLLAWAGDQRKLWFERADVGPTVGVQLVSGTAAAEMRIRRITPRSVKPLGNLHPRMQAFQKPRANSQRDV